ncbi:hypothetical protein ACFQQB_59210 [Nonomuraea rubra]|uniref:hypothetical protein n=1 Tax=Nonomuraea rubra TaxID=46180 RepID=UPI0036142E4F
MLAGHTGVEINLLHLSSAEALEAAARTPARRETTLHHLCLDHDDLDARGGLGGKVNPPIRTREHNEALWAGVADGRIDWVASDHACCLEEHKGDDLWPARPGFGGRRCCIPCCSPRGMCGGGCR